MKYNIGIDLGGTNIKVGLVDENYNIVAKATCKTDLPRPAEEIADSIAETVWKALNDAKVTIDELNSIGIGTPGTASRDTGVVLYSCNLGFRNTDLRSLIGARLGKQVYVENDANAAAFGEVLAGAGKGCRDVVVVTLGTGVGVVSSSTAGSTPDSTTAAPSWDTPLSTTAADPATADVRAASRRIPPPPRSST